MIDVKQFTKDVKEFDFHIVAQGAMEIIFCNGQVSIGIKKDGKGGRLIFDGGDVNFIYNCKDDDFWRYEIENDILTIKFGWNFIYFRKDGNLDYNKVCKLAYHKFKEK